MGNFPVRYVTNYQRVYIPKISWRLWNSNVIGGFETNPSEK